MAAPPPAHPPPQRWFRLRKFIIRSYWLTICLCVGLVLWSLWYVNNRGFSRKWRRILVEEMARRGVDVAVGRLTLNPLRGLVAKEVHIVGARDKGQVLATISEVELDINYSNLVHGLPFLNSVDLHDARVSFPLNAGDSSSEQLDVSGLNARVLFPSHQFQIDRAEADVHGLHITATGRLLNPEKLRADPAKPASPSSPHSAAQDYLKIWDSLKLKGGHPTLEIQFSGDVEKPSEIFAQGVLQSGAFSMGDTYKMQSAHVTATYSDGAIRFDQVSATDSLGSFDASGTYREATGDAKFQLRSTLDLQGLAHATHISRVTDELIFYSPPLLELNGEANFKGAAGKSGFQGKLLGRFSVDRFGAKSILFEGASADFSWDGDRWFVHDARIGHRSGELVMSAMQTPDEFRFSIDSRINPKVILPLLPSDADKVMALFDFDTPPAFHLEGRSASLAMEKLTASGQITLGGMRFRGTGLTSLVANIAIKDKTLSFDDFKIVRPEGTGTGDFQVDFEKNVVRLIKCKSTLIPTDVATWINPDLKKNLLPYRFKTRPSLLIDGIVQFRKGIDQTKLRIDVDGSSGMGYTFLKKDLYTPDVHGVVWVIKDRLKINDLDASLFGGRLTGDADISLLPGHGDYVAKIAVENIDFPSLTKLYFNYDTAKGKLAGTYDFSGRGQDGRAIIGKGELAVTDGNVFAIPVLGPFSFILNGIVPGAGYSQARKATATFDMKDGVIHTDDLSVDGKGFSMLGNGKLFFVDDKMDFNIRINAQGAAGVLLTPVSKMLEYQADTSLSKPVWHLKRIPKATTRP